MDIFWGFFDELGLSEYSVNQPVTNIGYFKSIAQSRLHYQFVQNWNSNTSITNFRNVIYRMYKNVFGFENYLNILPFNLAKLLCKFQTMKYSLPIEKELHFGIKHHKRFCTSKLN